ncbi:MAG: hypothetical protein KTR23_08715 [Rhodospirillales bacterium]|nr:hypothetical protein [Rhodospirillales bacterium]
MKVMKVMHDRFGVFGIEVLGISTLSGGDRENSLGGQAPAAPFWCAARGEVA